MFDILNKWAAVPGNEYDCCQFAGECIEAITGFNPAAGYVVESEADAAAILKQYGTLEKLACRFYGQPYKGDKPENYTPKDGDLAIVNINGRQIAGVIHQGRVVLRAPFGLTHWPPQAARGIWAT